MVDHHCCLEEPAPVYIPDVQQCLVKSHSSRMVEQFVRRKRQASWIVCGRRTLVTLLVLCLAGLAVCLHQLYYMVQKQWSHFHLSRGTSHLQDPYPWKQAGKIAYYTFTEDFHPINERGVYTFWNVCIEAIPGNPIQRTRQIPSRQIFYNETKRVVVYDSFFRSGQQSLLTAASINAQESRWDIFFSHDPVPDTHKWLPDTAFFISQSCPGNLHHFWNDEFIMLYSVMNMSNRLRPNSRNHVMYRTPWDEAPEEISCDDVHKYGYFFNSVYVHDRHEVFYKTQDNLCFRNAVFGLANLNYNSRLAVEYVIQKAGVKQKDCELTEKVIIIQRHHRKILNTQELAEAARLQGFHDVSVVILENMAIEEQLRIVACSSVMVGVQGAGLQWAIFMPKGSTLIEIAWPQKFWGFYFTNWVTAYGIDHKNLVAKHVHVNWAAYEQILRAGAKVSEDERQTLLHSPPKTTPRDNIWKWADVIIDIDEFKTVLESTKTPKVSS